MRIAKFNAYQEHRAEFVEGNFEVAGAAMQRNSAAITSRLYRLDSGSSSRPQEIQHALPMIRRAEMQAKEILVSELDCRLPRQMPQLSGGSMINVANAGVEAAHRAESRGESNLGHGKTSLVDQLLGEVQATRLSDRNWSCAQMP